MARLWRSIRHVLSLVLQTLGLLLVGSGIFGPRIGLLVVGRRLANNFSSSTSILLLFLLRGLLKVGFILRFYSRMLLANLGEFSALVEEFLLQLLLVAKNASLVF